MTTSFRHRLEWVYACAKAAWDHRDASEWPGIPITTLQPEGKWMHQRRAFWFAYHLENPLLAVTMGGGKTKIAIDLMLNWQAHKILVIAPLPVCEDAWVPQLARFWDQIDASPLSVAKSYEGSMKKRVKQAEGVMWLIEKSNYAGVVLINHEACWREPMRSFLLAQQWDLVVIDEIHREKSAGSRQSKFAFQLASRARRRLGLTGTPMPHSPLDLYGQFRFLDQGIFGTNHSKFEQEFAEFTQWPYKTITGYKNLDELKRKFLTIAIQIDDSEQGLPETVDIEHYVQLSPETRKIYGELDREFVTTWRGGEISAKNAGMRLLRLHQLASGVVSLEDGRKENGKVKYRDERVSDEKIKAVLSILQDLKEDESVVIFTRFNKDTQDLASRLNAYQLSGHANELKEWKKKGGVLVAQIQAAKEGIDLTQASIAIFYSTGISLGDYLQCRKRLHRPPQRRMVRFIHILARNTRDISTMRALRDREEVIRAVLQEID